MLTFIHFLSPALENAKASNYTFNTSSDIS